nr:S1 RNA-binding domain-containing protein [Thalassobacillus sp. C254]
MELQGTVRNVVDFGAFVDIGVKEDGLVHISKMSNRYVKHPMEIVSVGDVVTVWVESVDHKKGRISLTMIVAEKQTS